MSQIEVNLEEFLTKSRLILQADEDSWYVRKFDWFCNNFSGQALFDYIEDLVENCLNLAMTNSMQRYVRQQLMIQQRGLTESPQHVKKLARPTTRWSGLPDRITFRYQCTTCHELLVNPQSGCKCPGLPFGDHDNTENSECKKTCAERFGVKN